MKFICKTSVLSETCQNVQRAVSSKAAIPAIEGILIRAGETNSVYLTGYDLEMGINTEIDARVEKSGAIILNARLLCDILRRLPDENVIIEADERQVCTIRSGEAEYSLMGIAAEEYPELPSVTGGYPIIIDKKILKDMVRQTIFAVAVNDSKIVHTGIKFEIADNTIKLIAVDGFRLAIRKEALSYKGEDKEFIIPAKTLSEVVKLIDEEDGTVSLSIGKRHVVFEIENYSVISRLLDGEFLNYNSAIPTSSSTTVKVSTRDLIESIERTSLIITDKLKSPIRCIFDDNMIKISSITSLGSANDKIHADVEGKRVEIGFNNRFILEALKVCDTDEVKIALNGPISPILILPENGDSFLFLILPVRLKNEG